MALEIHKKEGKQVSTGKYKFTERVYATVTGEIVPEGDPAAATLVGTPGKTIPMVQAEALGLVSKPKPAAKKPARAPVKAPAKKRALARKKAPASPNKRRKTTAANKGK